MLLRYSGGAASGGTLLDPTMGMLILNKMLL